MKKTTKLPGVKSSMTGIFIKENDGRFTASQIRQELLYDLNTILKLLQS